MRSSFVILSILLVGAVSSASAEIIKFRTSDEDRSRFMFHPLTFYALMEVGNEATICVNLTTSAPIYVALGSCIRSETVGLFSNESVPFNRTFVNQALKWAREDVHTCKRKPIGIHVRASGKYAYGTIQVYQCVQSHIWSTSIVENETEVSETNTLEPMVTTWADLRRDIPFTVANGETWSIKVNFGRAIEAAIADPTRSICFAVHGTPLVKVTLGKCRTTNDFQKALPIDSVVSLDAKDRSILSKLKQQTCVEGTTTDEWWIRVNASDRRAATGYVTAYSCTELKTDDVSLPMYIPNVEIMGYEKTFPFSQRPVSEGIFSADIKQIVDIAGQNKEFTMQMEINTTSPISIVLTRCRSLTSKNRVILASQQSSGIITIDDVQKIVELLDTPKCETESDEALYLTIRSNTGASGTVKFFLKHATGVEARESAFLKNTQVFDVAPKTYAVRNINLGMILDETLSNKIPLGISVTSTGNITISVSKCPEAPRQVLLQNVGTGVHRVRFSDVAGALNQISNSPLCLSSPFAHHRVTLRIESHDDRATGTLQFVSLQVNGSRSTLPKFVDLDSYFKAFNVDQEIIVEASNGIIEPAKEIDIRFFVEIAMSVPSKVLRIETGSPVHITFSRCLNPKADGYEIMIPMRYNLDDEDLRSLLVLMRHPRCGNTALNGLFVHIADMTFSGQVKIYLEDTISG